ncbi:MAG TPA: energy transducer TonB [Candidatus Solibacter sp.]|nr:energy transducer TonB [Candidatus Solibacter sp.]
MGSSASDPSLFSMLPKGRTPWSEFVLSYGTQAVLVAVFVWIPVLHPEILEGPKKDYHAIELVPTPVPENHEPQRRLPPRPVLLAELDPPPTAALRLAAPQPRPKIKVEDSPAPEVKIAEKKLETMPQPKDPIVPKVIVTNTFSTGSSAPQTTYKMAQQVQTGGFGDPNGVPAKLNTGKASVNIASAGGFDLPTGPGYGNGTAGANGSRGVVASAGFGSGTATADPRAARATVRTGGFGDSDVPAPPTVQSRPAAAAAAKIVPAEILSKPTPIYTEEAKAQKIEGEVLLEVVFEASGKIHVVKVVRGLGHGLDDAAVRAAEQIRFKPALRDGQPSDSTAVLHIIFQLA